jgi:hypothetical protein
MMQKLRGALRADDLGYFVVSSAIFLGEGIGNIVVGPTKPLAIFSDSVLKVVGHVDAKQ